MAATLTPGTPVLFDSAAGIVEGTFRFQNRKGHAVVRVTVTAAELRAKYPDLTFDDHVVHSVADHIVPLDQLVS